MSGSSNDSVALRKHGNGLLAEVTVAAGLVRVWGVLTSFEEMPIHLSGLQKSRVLRRNGASLLVEQTATVGVAVFSFPFRVLMEVVEDRPFLYFDQRLGSFARFCGHWRVDPRTERVNTRVQYYLEVEMARGLRRQAVELQLHRMVRQNLQELAVWMENSERENV
ncbi:MAG: SRPBCC family protein [Deltaproteobacteria bacterium]|nr:MAG: SRPBCC family protein [Deltaproteobacteria bacterium]